MALDASPRESQGCFPRNGPVTDVPLCESSFPILPIVGQPRQQRQRDARACAAAAWNTLCEVTRAVRIFSNHCLFETNGTQDFRNVGFMKVLSIFRDFSSRRNVDANELVRIPHTEQVMCVCSGLDKGVVGASGHALRATTAVGLSPRSASQRAPAPGVSISWTAAREPLPRHFS